MSLPPNVHVSSHPIARAKLSQLRSSSADSKTVKNLVREIALIVGVEATATLSVENGPIDKTPLGYEYSTTVLNPASVSLVPILRSGLGMVEALQDLLPTAVPVFHLGLFREPSTLSPVEYYNNLPYHNPSTSAPSAPNSSASEIAILLDPVIATGGTCSAAIQTLKEWGVKKVVVIAILGASVGVHRVSQEWAEGTEIFVGGLDQELSSASMIKPGVGDIGDRLFLTIGK